MSPDIPPDFGHFPTGGQSGLLGDPAVVRPATISASQGYSAIDERLKEYRFRSEDSDRARPLRTSGISYKDDELTSGGDAPRLITVCLNVGQLLDGSVLPMGIRTLASG